MSADPRLGDFDEPDAFDIADADPEAVARRLLIDERDLSGDVTRPLLDGLHPFERALLVFAVARLLGHLRREGGV